MTPRSARVSRPSPDPAETADLRSPFHVTGRSQVETSMPDRVRITPQQQQKSEPQHHAGGSFHRDPPQR